MNHLPQRSQGKSGDYVESAVVPANVLAEPHFDAVIVLLFALCVGGLIYWIFG